MSLISSAIGKVQDNFNGDACPSATGRAPNLNNPGLGGI